MSGIEGSPKLDIPRYITVAVIHKTLSLHSILFLSPTTYLLSLMSILRDAHDFVISGGDFRIHNHFGRSGIDILREASSPGATFDSREHYDRRCFPGTREQYITDIIDRATASEDILLPIYWMRGPAGVGKSAIAQTCAEKLESAGYLGAAFFFTVKKHDDPLRLFTTIAYQLATAHIDYRTILDNKISMDKTIVEKRLSSQFKLLIVEPLQELKRQGKGIGKRTVFIDGLDECTGEDAQAEIVEIIASSVRAGSTPFRWAVFSRSEPRLVSTFTRDDIAGITDSVELPISRKADTDIELYLRGEFKNILQRQNCLRLSSSWPTNEDIKTLVDTAAGLFAHPAAALRFVGYPLDWQFQERLQAILDFIRKPNIQSSGSTLPELDALYLLIMSRIPDDLLAPTQLILYFLVGHQRGFTGNAWRVTLICNLLGFSESVFRRMCHALHAVVCYQELPEPGSLLDLFFDRTRSFYDKSQKFQLGGSVQDRLFTIHGLLGFYHKSFYDFLIDPARSSTFCVTTSAIRDKYFERCIQQHHHYASGYVIDGSKLALAPNVASSSVSLSWPQGSELVDSFLNQKSFGGLSSVLSHDDLDFWRFIQDAPLKTLQQLAELDYRKSMIAGRVLLELLGWPNATVLGVPGNVRALSSHSIFERPRTDKLDTFKPAEFLSMVERLQKAGVIQPYHPRFGSGPATSVIRMFSPRKSYRKSCGLYELGHGEKSVIWYWDFDMDKRYFHKFETIDYATAMEYYKTNKFTMWNDKSKEDVGRGVTVRIRVPIMGSILSEPNDSNEHMNQDDAEEGEHKGKTRTEKGRREDKETRKSTTPGPSSKSWVHEQD